MEIAIGVVLGNIPIGAGLGLLGDIVVGVIAVFEDTCGNLIQMHQV